MVQKPESGIEPKERRIDLSLPQVAGSAVAAVAAAVAASQLGVYGTILGAGVMSIVATCGGSVFQHFFRRTGEQIREVTVQVVKHPQTGAPVVLKDADATTVLRKVPEDPARTQLIEPLDGTRQLVTVPEAGDDAYSPATTHGTRIRGWKRSALGAAVVFVVSMAGITTYELVSGNDLSGGQGTTVGSVVRGEHHRTHSDPAPADNTGPDGDATTPADGDGSATPGTGGQDGRSTAPEPDRSDGPTTGPSPTPTPSDSAGGGTDPGPAPSPTPTGSGTGVAPDPTGTADAPAQEDRAPADAGAGE
ncbi:hypothetical protein [Streptomyces sp. ITFR-16]|uniref:hypothetical protein n=1 Tax=Streptomyces sp. ITFR-16 TaxID=3075198 RepID=UPI00288902B4|nr:hypothetical protein [Streptomyces sp. ITFR-16]WNI22000.1 hypothetical protein RLT58_08615 [Streptomyces sp. ITFR-16]